MILERGMKEKSTLPINALNTLTQLSKSTIISLVNCAQDELLKQHYLKNQITSYDPLEKLEINDTEKIILQEAFAIVNSIVVVFAKEKPTTNEDQIALLKECGIEDMEFTNWFLPIIFPVWVKIRLVLEQTNFDFANVIDVSWRQDFVLITQKSGKCLVPQFLIQLTIQMPDGTYEKISFSCTEDQLKEIVYQIEEAMQQIETLCGNNN